MLLRLFSTSILLFFVSSPAQAALTCFDIFSKPITKEQLQEVRQLFSFLPDFKTLQKISLMAKELHEEFPELSLANRTFALMVVEQQPDALPFVKKILSRYSEKRVGHYLALLIHAEIMGDRLILFEEAVGRDVEFGYEVLRTNDRTILDDVTGPEAPLLN